MTGLSARVFLFGDADERGVAPQFESRGLLAPLAGALGGLSGGGRAAAGREVTGAMLRLLEFDLGAVLAAGWQTAGALVNAARSTLNVAGSTEVVELASHRVSAVHQPAVDVLFDGHAVASLSMEIRATFEVHSLVGTVRAGRLVNVECGQCDATVAVLVAGQELARRTERFDAPLLVQLGNGIPLLADTTPHQAR
jgi:hypothetical protein